MRRLLLFTFSCARIAALVALECLATAAYAQTITTFDVPNSTLTYPTAVNSAGVVTGYYQDASGQHGFLRYADGTFATFDVPGSTSTHPTGISPAGHITGYSDGPIISGGSIEDPNYEGRGFVRQKDGTIDIFDACNERITGPFIYIFTYPQSISASGDVAGLCDHFAYMDEWKYGFIRQSDGTTVSILIPDFFRPTGQGAFLNPQAINPRGQITGAFARSLVTHGFSLRDGVFIEFDVYPGNGYRRTQPQAINPAGQITGFGTDIDSETPHGFLRQPDGTITRFDPDGSISTNPQAINPAGQITGFYVDASLVGHGFLWQHGNISTFDAPHAIYTYPTAISPAGQITGWYSEGTIVHGFVRSK